jgi:hypothetical protein
MTDPFEHLYKKEEVESWEKLQCYLRLSLPESQPSIRVSRAAVCWAQGSSLLGWKRRIALASTSLSRCKEGIHGQQLTTSSGLGR